MLVSACGEDSFGPSSDSKSELMEIRTYQVNDTLSTAAPDDVLEQLNRNEFFNVSWLLFSTEPHHVELWLSNTQSKFDPSAVSFYSVDCGSDRTAYPLCGNGQRTNFNCSYDIATDGETYISCVGGVDQIQIITKYNGSDAYMLLFACDDLSTNCQTRAVKVNMAL